jgi:hypothetical protein
MHGKEKNGGAGGEKIESPSVAIASLGSLSCRIILKVLFCYKGNILVHCLEHNTYWN